MPILMKLLPRNLFLALTINTMGLSIKNMHTVEKKKFIEELLKNNFKISDETTVTKLITNETSFLDLSENHIKQVATILNTNKVDLTHIEDYGKILCMKPNVLKHKIFLLQELGVKKLDLNMLDNYLRIMALKPYIFKAHMGIDSNVNLIENIYSHLKSVPKVPDIDQNLKLNKYCLEASKHYLIWKLNISEDEKSIVFNWLKLHHHLSFRIIESVIHVLKNELKFSDKKIKENLRLIAYSPEVIMPIYEKLDNLTSEASKMISRCPRLLNRDISDIMEVVNYIKECEIPVQYIRKWPEILVFSPQEFRRRLDTLLSYPELRIFMHHPRFLKLICYFRMVETRLKHMTKFSQEKSSTIKLLTGDNMLFKSEMNYEVHKVEMLDLVNLLNKDFKTDPLMLKNQLKKHPYWKYSSLIQVERTFKYLKKHFTLKDIYENLYAVFYSCDSINNAFQSLKAKYSDTEDSSIPCLALCIYEIELDHNFSGDGIWTEETQRYQNQIHNFKYQKDNLNFHMKCEKE